MTTKADNEDRLTDTPLEVERLQIDLLRKASVTKHIKLLRSLSLTVMNLSRRAIREARPYLKESEFPSIFIALQYESRTLDSSAAKIEALEKSRMDKPDLMIALIPVVEVLKRLGTAYYIGGSVAGSAYGLPRATLDVDLIADLRKEQIGSFVESLRDAYYVDETRVRDAVDRRSSFNLIHFDTVLKVDVFVSKMRPYDQEVFRRVLLHKLDETEGSPLLCFESPEDVVLAKLEWFRAGGETSQLQWSDILGIFKVQAEKLDVDYLSKWAEQLGLNDLLEKAIAEAKE